MQAFCMQSKKACLDRVPDCGKCAVDTVLMCRLEAAYTDTFTSDQQLVADFVLADLTLLMSLARVV